MRRPRIRLRTLMIAVALSAMMLAVAAPALREWWAPSVWRITVSEPGSGATVQIDTTRLVLWRAPARTQALRKPRASRSSGSPREPNDPPRAPGKE